MITDRAISKIAACEQLGEEPLLELGSLVD